MNFLKYRFKTKFSFEVFLQLFQRSNVSFTKRTIIFGMFLNSIVSEMHVSIIQTFSGCSWRFRNMRSDIFRNFSLIILLLFIIFLNLMMILDSCKPCISIFIHPNFHFLLTSIHRGDCPHSDVKFIALDQEWFFNVFLNYKS